MVQLRLSIGIACALAAILFASAAVVLAAPRVSVVKGIASWGPFHGHVVTRLPRGTSILVTGPLGAWTGSSWGYGPAKWTNRIVDLDASVFKMICGPLSRGLCNVTLAWSQ